MEGNVTNAPPCCDFLLEKLFFSRTHGGDEDVPDGLELVPVCHTAGQGDLEHGVALQDLPHTVKHRLTLPLAQQPRLELLQRLLVVLHGEQRRQYDKSYSQTAAFI